VKTGEEGPEKRRKKTPKGEKEERKELVFAVNLKGQTPTTRESGSSSEHVAPFFNAQVPLREVFALRDLSQMNYRSNYRKNTHLCGNTVKGFFPHSEKLSNKPNEYEKRFSFFLLLRNSPIYRSRNVLEGKMGAWIHPS